MSKNRPILIQGAMQVEIEYLMKYIKNLKKIEINGYDFYEGEIDNYPVVVSKTNVGEIEMSVATLLGILKYNPKAVIIQGTAGSHDLNLYKHDIVVGTSCVNINSFEAPIRGKGQGSNPFNWQLKTFKEGIEIDKLIPVPASQDLIEVAKKVKNNYKKGKVVFGVIGGGDVWNKEWDRIEWLNKNYHTLCEDMESIATYTICNKQHIPVIGIRVISNNERIEDQTYERESGLDSQEFVIELCREYIRRI